MTGAERLIVALLRRIVAILERRAPVALDERGQPPCPECGVYGGGHMQGCSLMPADE